MLDGRSQESWILILTPPATCWMTLGHSLTLSLPQFPQLPNGDSNIWLPGLNTSVVLVPEAAVQQKQQAHLQLPLLIAQGLARYGGTSAKERVGLSRGLSEVSLVLLSKVFLV